MGERAFSRAGANSLYSRYPEPLELVRPANSILVLGEGLFDAPFCKDVALRLVEQRLAFSKQIGVDSVVRLGNIGHVSKHGPRSIA